MMHVVCVNTMYVTNLKAKAAFTAARTYGDISDNNNGLD